MSKKIFIIAVIIAIFISASLFYLFTKHEKEDVIEAIRTDSKLFISWQKITITEEEENISINISVPRVIIPSNYDIEDKVNKGIIYYIEYLKNDFISAVSTAAEDNGEINTLNIDTEILLITPRLISLALTKTEDLAGINDHDPERTFFVFDLINGKRIIEDNEFFRNDSAWFKAVRMIEASLFSDYQKEPNCDLLFAPKYNGFAASCIGVDWDRGGEHISVNGNIPISMIQEFIAPSILSDIIQ